MGYFSLTAASRSVMELSILKRSSRAREKDRAMVLKVVSFYQQELQLWSSEVQKTYD